MTDRVQTRSKRTRKFKKQFKGLPDHIQELAEDLFKIFTADPNDPVLETDAVYDSRKGRHRKGSRSVRVTLGYRALYVVDNGKDGDQPEQYCWYWIGTREDYGTFIGCS